MEIWSRVDGSCVLGDVKTVTDVMRARAVDGTDDKDGDRWKGMIDKLSDEERGRHWV